MAFTSEEIICGIAPTMVVMMVGRFWMREISRFTPASMIWGMLPRMAVTSPSMICGIAATMAVMISGSAETSEVNSCIPALMICGIAPTINSTIAVMMAGRAAIRTGMALSSPWASPMISCSAASRIIGRFSIRVCTIWVTTRTICGISVGTAAAMPWASVTMICVAPSITAGRLWMMPESSEVSICIPVFTNCGSMETAVFTSPVMAPAKASSAPSTPLTMSVKAEMTSEIAGRNSARRLFFTLDMVSPSPARVSSSCAWPSRDATSASLLR